MSLLQALNWRYAAKRMNGQKVPAEKLDYILEATRLSASCMGLQPYTILVIEDAELRKKIQTVANNQPQIVEASHLMIFTAWDKVKEEHIADYLNNIASERDVHVDTLSGFKNSMTGFIQNRNEEQNFNWAARQTYIAFGTAIAAAAEMQIDATPMEGFNAAQLDELLGLKEKGLRSLTILALGYRDAETDFLVNAKKVRRKTDELFLKVA